MGPDEMHLQVLRELADEVTKAQSTVFDKSWQSGEVPTGWKSRNITLVFKKGKKEDPGELQCKIDRQQERTDQGININL